MPFYFKDNIRTFVDLLPANLELLRHEATANKDITWEILVKKKIGLEYGNGRFVPELGYLLRVIDVIKVGEGLVQFYTGLIRHEIIYSAITVFPVRGEVIDAEVIRVNPESIIFVYAGVLRGIINICDFPSDSEYEYRLLKTFDNPEGEGIPGFVSLGDHTKFMIKSTGIRVRIARRSVGNDGYWLLGTMQGKFLGITDKVVEETLQLNTKGEVKGKEGEVKSSDVTA